MASTWAAQVLPCRTDESLRVLSCRYPFHTRSSRPLPSGRARRPPGVAPGVPVIGREISRAMKRPRAGKGGTGEQSMRVLLVEDHRPLVRALRQGLEEEGFAVDIA